MWKSREYFWIGVLGFVTTLAFAPEAPATQLPERIVIGEPEERPKLVVNATAEVTAKPDLATVELVVTTTESKLQKAFDKSTEASNRVLASLKQRGVRPEDIQTKTYHIQPIYDGKRKPVRYTVTHQITAKIRNFETLGPILDDAVEEEVTEVRQISFSVEEPYRLEQAARIKAAQLAREKAQDLATNTGAKLGRVLKLSENAAWPGPIVVRGDRFTLLEKSVAQAKEAYLHIPEMAPGSLKFSVTCHAEYSLES